MSQSYESKSFIEELESLQNRLNKLHQQRANSIRPLSPESEKTHQEVLTMINELSPQPIKRKVFSSRDIMGQGCLVEVDGKTQILIHEDVATFYPSLDYSVFKKNNSGRRISPKDYFKDVVAHEYGHILFSERIEPALRSRFRYEDMHSPIPGEFDEAFAFIFGDRINGLSTPLEGIVKFYEPRLNASKLLRAYQKFDDLANRSGDKAIFDVQSLAPILNDMIRLK